MRCRAILILAVLAMAGREAAAHAFLDHSSPPVGGVVTMPPVAIRITFTEALEPLFSGIDLAVDGGSAVKTGAATTDPSDPRTLVLPVPKLAAGRYRVRWHVVSVDTHRTAGDFTFEIRP